MIQIEILHTAAGGGRTGRLHTPHGPVQTPAFMPVGTYGSVRGLTPAQLLECGTEMLLSNSYHLALRPGAETISNLGGLHRFMGWERPILTDSGGYQLFSLAAQVRIDEEGAVFRSQYDGAPFKLTPERAAQNQRLLGVDVGMVFDALTGRPDDRDEAGAAAARTLRWAERTRDAGEISGPTSFFAILQGGLFEDLRRENAEAIGALDFPGYAVGGLSVGESPERTMETASYSARLLPAAKPRYMMGMGTPQDLIRLCGWGYDLFDCVLPTRNARNGTLFTGTGKLSIRNARHAQDRGPIDESCGCYACGDFSRGYVHHLAKRGEMLAAVLGSIHNVHFYQQLMRRIREALAGGDYQRFADDAMTELSRESEV